MIEINSKCSLTTSIMFTRSLNSQLPGHPQKSIFWPQLSKWIPNHKLYTTLYTKLVTIPHYGSYHLDGCSAFVPVLLCLVHQEMFTLSDFCDLLNWVIVKWQHVATPYECDTSCEFACIMLYLY